MPSCHLTREFLRTLEKQKVDHIVHYTDKDLPGFLLEKRPNNSGTWYFRYRKSDKKNHYCRLGTLAKLDVIDARARAYDRYRSVLEGHEPKRAGETAAELTISQYVTKYYLPYVKASKRSWKADEGMLRIRILPIFRETFLASVRNLDVVNWLQGMHKHGLCPSSCNRTLALFRFFFNCAIRWGLLPAGSNPCSSVHPLEDNGNRERYLSSEEALALIEELDEMSSPSAQVVKLLLFTGARKSEILNARWEYVNFERRILTVPLSKSGKARHIPLSDEAMAILRSIPQTGNPWVFPNPKTGKPMHNIFHFWDTVRRNLHMPDLRLHDLRHSFASFLVNSGCTLYEVQKILGHYDPKVTMRYAHLSSGSLIRAANTVPLAIMGTALKRVEENIRLE